MNKIIADRYMVITSLGEGGMADVYLAVDTILNREVAVKVLRGELREDPVAQLRFLREASAISKLNHPNIVEVYDVGEYDDKNYIVMEYVRGRTLKQLILQRGALQKEEAVEIMKQLVSAVNHAHENNIIHRDIKPQNILVKDDGTIKITDFGIALAHDAVSLTQTDSILGSAHYIAPETTKGETPTIQVDIYALGIVFYELLKGNVPFSGENPVQIAMKHLREEIPSIISFNPTLPQSVENIIIKATAKNRLKRYSNAKEMLYDLDMCLLPQFANVDKIDLAEEEESSGTVVLNTVRDIDRTKETTKTATSSEVKDVEVKKSNGIWMKIAMIVGILVLSVASVIGVYYSGLIDGFSPIKMVEVPDLTGMSIDEAKIALENIGLFLDEDIEKEMTDDIEEGLIFDQSISEGDTLQEGKKVSVVISNGKYFVIEDYTGKILEDIRSELEAQNITIYVDYENTSEYAPGTIMEQKLKNEGEKINPKVENKIRFTVAASIEIRLDDFVGAKIETAKNSLENDGIKVILEKLPTDEMTPEELDKIETGVVIKQTPEAYTTYRQEGNNVVILYYY